MIPVGNEKQMVRFKLGEVFNRYFGKSIPTIVPAEDGEYVKLHEVERLQEELTKCYRDNEKYEEVIRECFAVLRNNRDEEIKNFVIKMKLQEAL